jgi:predicted PurR-regulated permease PerM
MNKELKLTFYKSLTVGAAVLVLYLIYRARIILPTVLYGAIIAYLLLPITNLFSKKMPRWLASLITMLIFIFIFSLIVYFFIPVIIHGTNEIALKLPQIYNNISRLFDWIRKFVLPIKGLNSSDQIAQNIIAIIQDNLKLALTKWAEFTINKIALIPSLILSIMLGFFFMKESPVLYRVLLRNIKPGSREPVKNLLTKTNLSLRAYFGTLVIISICTGFFMGLAAYVAGIKFFLLIGILDACLEIIPYIGPTIVFIIGGTISLFTSLKTLIVFSVLFSIVEIVQNNFIIPHFVGERLKISPVIIIIMIAAGGVLLGALGVLIATPSFIIIKNIIDAANLYKEKT